MARSKSKPTQAALLEELQDIVVPLNKLFISPLNVRRNDSRNYIEEFADNIAARGLLQPIIVKREGEDGQFGVFAGGRRYNALSELVKRGTIAEDYAVRAKLFDGADKVAVEISYTENFQRENMTALDELKAIQYLTTNEKDLDKVAKRLGLSRRMLDQRLRLLDLSPQIFEAFETGKITLEVAKAFAASPNRDRQDMVFAALGCDANPDTIRRRLALDTLSANHAVAKLVTEAAYLAAGGRIEQDLFTTGAALWLDPEIAIMLADDIATKAAERLQAESGLAFVIPLLHNHVPFNESQSLHRYDRPCLPLTEEQEARRSAIDDELQDLYDLLEQDELSEEDETAKRDQISSLEAEAETLDASGLYIPDDMKSLVGCFAILNSDLEFELDARFYTKERVYNAIDDSEGSTNTREGPAASSQTGGAITINAQGKPSERPLSAKLVNELATQRRDILALNLAQNPALALDYLAFCVVDRSAYGYSDDAGTTIACRRSETGAAHSPYPVSPAKEAITTYAETLPSSWRDHDDITHRFRAFQQLDAIEKTKLIALAVSETLKCLPGHRIKSTYGTTKPSELQDELAQQMDINVADHWRPTAENYFDRIGKGIILNIFTEVGGAEFAGRYASSKKSELAQAAETIFSGEAIIEPEIKDAAASWYPPIMGFTRSNNGKFKDPNDADPNKEVANTDDAEHAQELAEVIA